MQGKKMIVSAKVKLADARAELGFSQANVALFASVSKQVVVNAENDRAIQRIQAHRILHYLNAERTKAGKPPLTITDIDWKIVGE
jgi:DNA-binding XRE family transcriptional regulator